MLELNIIGLVHSTEIYETTAEEFALSKPAQISVVVDNPEDGYVKFDIKDNNFNDSHVVILNKKQLVTLLNFITTQSS